MIPIRAAYTTEIFLFGQDGKPQTLADKAAVHVNGAGLARRFGASVLPVKIHPGASQLCKVRQTGAAGYKPSGADRHHFKREFERWP